MKWPEIKPVTRVVEPVHKIFKENREKIKQQGVYVVKWPDDDPVPNIKKEDIRRVISHEKFRYKRNRKPLFLNTTNFVYLFIIRVQLTHQKCITFNETRSTLPGAPPFFMLVLN